MTGWVTVEVRHLSAPVHPQVPEGFLVVPAAACRVVAYPGDRRTCHGGFVVDEHFAVDADRCRQSALLRCADVLYGSRGRCWDEAVAWLAQVTVVFEGCRLAASPLGEGRWAVQGGAGGSPVRIAAGCEQSAVASCVHGWMVAGGLLHELAADPCGAQPRAALTDRAGRLAGRRWGG